MPGVKFIIARDYSEDIFDGRRDESGENLALWLGG